MASTYIKRTQVSGSRNKFTFSAWIKRGAIGTNQQILSCYHGNSDDGYIEFRFQGSGDSLHCSGYSTNWFRTNRAFRDVNAWYHIVYAVDTTQATSGNRMKLYVNGVEETSFATQSQPSQNFNLPFGAATSDIRIGVDVGANAQFFDGSMSHVHFCDGYTYQPSDFGQTDATTGEWKIKTAPSVSYGNNGFFILKDGNSVTDQSGQSHDCTVAGGTLTKTEDCPSNIFCTGNPLAIKVGAGPTFSNGNNVMAAPNGSPYDVATVGTLGMSTGKFYWECKWTYGGQASNQALFLGIVSTSQPLDVGGNMVVNTSYNNVGYNPNGGDLRKNGADIGTNYAGSVNSIFGFALDLDNGTLKIHENGTYFNSGNAVVTGISDDTYVPLLAPNGGSTTSIISSNFGNGYFGTTAVSSAGTNASGNGIFEYDVPTGYTALSTKGLNL